MKINELLRQIRGRDSLREASEKTKLSHTYIRLLEKGIDPRTKSTLKPTPDTLRSYSIGYHYDYDELMIAAGYIDSGEQRELNDQTEKTAMHLYNRLPQDEKNLIDDMIRKLLDKRREK